MSAPRVAADATASSSSSSSSSCNNGTFVTVLSNMRYAQPAICLRRQMRRVKSACPFLLVYNDADSQLPLPLLERTFGRDGLLPLSSLKARFRDYARPLSGGGGGSNHSSGQPSFLAPVKQLAVQRAATADASAATSDASGRRLFQKDAGVSNTHHKLWLWALPVARAVFLDIDMLVLQNVDSLLSMELPPHGPGGGPKVGAVTCPSKYGNRYFNSGLLVFEPSLDVLKRLLTVERWANMPWNGYIPSQKQSWPNICAPADEPDAASRLFPNASNPFAACRAKYQGKVSMRMDKACEQKFTDQSIFNFAFGSHALLPTTYNDARSFNLSRSRIIHFVGEPKPWDSTNKAAHPDWHNAAIAYRSACHDASSTHQHQGGSTHPHMHPHNATRLHAHNTIVSRRAR